MQKRQPYNIKTTEGNFTVLGRKIQVPGYEKVDFLIHKDIHGKTAWTISELTTGRKVITGSSGMSQKDLIENAASFMAARNTQDELLKRLGEFEKVNT